MSSRPPKLRSGRSVVTLDGVALEALWLPGEDPGQTTWVLLHEGLGCVDMWRDFPSMLGDSTADSVFVFSRRGYGRSDPVALPRPLDYMQREATEVVGQVLEHLPGQQFILLGHSDGGSIAALHAGLCAHPKLAGVLLVAPHFFPEAVSIRAIREAKTAFDNGILRERLVPFHFSNIDCAFNGWCDAWLDERFLDWDIRHCLAGISVPMLLLQGDKDSYGTLRQIHTAAAMAGGWTEQKILPDCGHSPHRESPAELLEACLVLRSKCGL